VSAVCWTLVALASTWIAFAYVGYPAVLWLFRTISPRPVRSADVFPPLSVVIAVHNAGEALRRKLEATLALDYPGPWEIVVTSDGSTDDTVASARAFADRGVRVVENRERRGKEAAQAAAIPHTKGELLVFTDVGAELEPGALRAIARPFGDPGVGCVSSEDRVEGGEGEGAYVRFEMALRRLENETSTLVGCSGSFFAVRRDLAEPWPEDLASDFRSALEAARRQLRAVSAPDARARFRAIHSPAGEWRRKVRTVRRGIAVLSAYRDLLHPRYGRAALSLWGHKVARFTSPFALLALLAATAAGSNGSVALAVLLWAQLLGYALGAASLAWPALRGGLVPRLAGFFLLVNASMLVAWIYHLSGRRAVTWDPTRR
jgi:cellulose synthase/poly-beta-1,6-N-acetylglucosamine synthase-like glycosyltransferase